MVKPADDPTIDYKALVQRAYDRCAANYAESRKSEAHPELDLLRERLCDGASVLDIGCGGGVPITRALADKRSVTGVDTSYEMIRQARANVPGARFVHDDIMSVEFPASSFDAVVAFYSIFHVPREEHCGLFLQIHDWLRPGGYLMCTLTRYSESAYTEDDFFGETMYWSNYGLADYEDMLTRIGFSLIEMSTIGHGYSEVVDRPPEIYPLVFARKQ